MRVAKLANLTHNLTYVFRLIANIINNYNYELEYNHAHVEVQPYNAVLDLHATVPKFHDD